MNLKELKPRKALNKAFLKVKPNRTEIERFKSNLIALLDASNDKESEEYHKNLVSDFLKKTYYDPNHFINTKGRNDLVIHNGKDAKSSVGVIVEAKKPTNKSEMLTSKKINTKAFQELVLYYLRERITEKNLEVKYLIATNINEWFVFDAVLFDRLFAQNKELVKQFTDFEGGRLADTKTDFFYKQIAEPFITKIEVEIEFTYFNIQDYQDALRNEDKADDNKLISLFKLLSPEHLLKLPFTNDSNSLDKGFYSELLHIIGLTETKIGGKKLIERNKDGQRNTGSLLEDAIIQLDSLDKIQRLDNPAHFGITNEERLFNVGLQLAISWINRILFLKLLEAQLLTYHKGDKEYAFLNHEKIKSYDDLNSLFFQVLAKKTNERNQDVKKAFEKVPYLNSSLFEPTNLEQATLFISNLGHDKTIPIISSTVLKNEQGKKRTGDLNTLHYLFEFLNAYDFANEGAEEIQEENKSLINASVLGLIFEKINGYKDGSFFTPGFITMYMCRETIRKAVVQKFNEAVPASSAKGEGLPRFKSLDDIYDQIDDDRMFTRQQANEIVNSLKICDPAVGSGHFLVSALNEIIAVKNDLKILQDTSGKRLKEYQFEVVNDELIVTDDEGELFEYNPTRKESQRVQETLFLEKQTIIENCLFGVDINPNSVKICRLRLWIELLKNAYYTSTTATTSSSPPVLGGVPAGGGGEKTQPNPAGGGGEKTQPNPTWGGGKMNNLPHLKTFRKNLRNKSTAAEATLWTILKGKGLQGKKFRRQHSVANYILDFYCPEERIAIELDGQGHFEASQQEYDRERDLFLETFGIRVLRFENKWVFDNPEGLLLEVAGWFGKQPPLAADTAALKGGVAEGRGGELQTLPNIDINIKCGNSLVSRFAIDADLSEALKKSKWTIDSYRIAVDTYRNAKSKEQKREMEKLIATIKSDFRSEIAQNDPKLKKLYKLNGDLTNLTTQQSLFEMSKKEKADWNKKLKKLTDETKKLEQEIEEIKSNKIFENAFEWRFEFPEVLNEKGDFVGFDVVIGNPPYMRVRDESDQLRSYYFENYKVSENQLDLYHIFIEKSFEISNQQSIHSLIVPNAFLANQNNVRLRQFILANFSIERIIEVKDDVFEEASVEVMIFIFSKPYVQSLSQYYKAKSGSFYFINDFDSIAFYNTPNNNFTVTVDIKRNEIISKILDKSVKLSDLFNTISGIKEYQVGKGKPKQNDQQVKGKVFNSSSKINDTYLPELRGKNLSKYTFSWENEFISYGIWLAEPRVQDFFDGEKILIRQIPAKKSLIASFVKETFVVDQTAYIAKPKKELNILFYLGLLNSTLLFWYFQNMNNEFDNLFPKIKVKEFNSLPIPNIQFVNNKVSNIVDEILNIKSTNPSADTSKLETEIDHLVYKLYDLTAEEIEIVEGSGK